jgi:hypothetical protein
MAAAQLEALLRRFQPALIYDSQEAYFADHPAQMVVNPGNRLRRKDGKVFQQSDGSLTLETLATTYADGVEADPADVLAVTTGQDYQKYYAALREAHPELKNHIVARAQHDSDGRLWLQYWLWYFYNDYRLAANYGLHEGDWEMVQLRLVGEDPVAAQPDYAVYAQHAHAQRQPWDQVNKDPHNSDTALVYIARGSHASYFRPGVYPTEVWADVCDAARPSPTSTLLIVDDDPHDWAGWPGRWGDTKAGHGVDGALTSDSPDGPCRKKQFKDPKKLFDSAYTEKEAGRPLLGLGFDVGRRDGLLVVSYNVKYVKGTVTQVVINVNSAQEKGTPPKTYTFPLTRPTGQILSPIPVAPEHSYDVRLSVDVRRDGAMLPSVTVTRVLDPGSHEPKRLLTTSAGVALVSAQQWVKRLFRRR